MKSRFKQHSGAECRGGSRAGRRSGHGLCGGGRRGPQPGTTLRPSRQGYGSLDRGIDYPVTRRQHEAGSGRRRYRDHHGERGPGERVDRSGYGGQEQSLSIEQISRALVQIEQVTQKTAENAQENAAAGKALTEQSEALQGVAERLSALV